jgi:hypothetical protein
VDEHDIERVLAACDADLRAGGRGDLSARGFWRAVAAVKRDPRLVPIFADRIGDIDRRAFRKAVPLHFPIAFGWLLLGGATVVGVGLLAIAPSLADPLDDLAVLVGMGGVLVGTHDLTHLVVGSALGMRFTDVFSKGPRRPQPGVKLDYATYLRVPARGRAWMHASGAIVSKIVPFAVAVYGLAIGTAVWAIALMVAVGLVSIVIDAVLSVKKSDWQRFNREMTIARSR